MEEWSKRKRALLYYTAARGGYRASSTNLTPSATWNGTAGTGFSVAPSDPVRTTAKPFLRQLFVENEVFVSDYTVVFDAHAKDGISKVRVHCEGNYIDVTAPSWVPYADANGAARLMYGYAATLNKAAFDAITASGTANIYAEAFPVDGTMQNRVIGPFAVHNRASLYAGTRTVGSGGDHATVQAALNWITTNSPSARNYRIQIITTAEYDLSASVTTTYNSATQWVTIEAAGGVTATMTAGATRTDARLKYDGTRFKGSGIVFDLARINSIVMESTGNGLLWLDGCSVVQTGGKFAVFDGIFPLTYWIRMNTGSGSRFYSTDCAATGGIYNGFSNHQLVRNCSIDDVSGDAFQNNRCVHGVSMAKLSPTGVGGLRTHVNAVNVTYTGGGVPKIAITNGPNVSVGAGTRSLQCYVDGATVGTALTITNPSYSAAGSGYTTWAAVAAHIDALADFAATVDGAAGTRRASSASKSGLGATETMANGTGRELTFTTGSATITSIFDVHGDGTQYFGNWENYGGRFATLKNVDTAATCQGFYVDQTSTTFTDCWFRNFEIATDGGVVSGTTQVFSVWSHSGVEKFTIYDQPFWLRTDAAGASKFNPDSRCAFRNISAFSMLWQGGAQDTDLVLDSINTSSGSPPTGTTNGTTVSANLYVNAPADLSAGSGMPAGVGARTATNWNV
tara:strand:+ start:562 stop:2604 length:2043 start_codon:yes stop_codon:yes gene_type:complete